ncbi:hypothetical protein C5167_037087 [Papaver somniferum]|uniref:Uncharacterized protein n=1 Tax=Papaver somniferum TaxID=3469 RepID=A0A4Y7I9H1_PAPSO|nr:hypothetical protein C5167_037087 [Papaver somniferum]
MDDYPFDRSPWKLIIKAVGMPGHGSRMFDNSAMEHLMRHERGNPGTSGYGATVAPVNQQPSAFDEFDPRSFAPVHIT